MTFLELAEKRTSIRSYENKGVEQEKLTRILEAARLAPSACNIQPFHIIVIERAETKEKLRGAYDNDWFVGAPVILAVCAEPAAAWKRGDGKDYSYVDAAIAMDHITLAAADLGLGTCWIGAFTPDALRQALCLPDGIEPVAMTPIGYPGHCGNAKNRKELNQLIHYEQYGNNEPSE